MNETQFQDALIDLLHFCHYKVAHFRPALTQQGWRTAVAADGAGFYDLVAIGHGRCLFIECKGKYGKLSPEQESWRAMAEACSKVEYYLWYSNKNLEEIAKILRK